MNDQQDEMSFLFPESEPSLSELIDAALLQRFQEWVAQLTGRGLVLRDAHGHLVTRPSGRPDFRQWQEGQRHFVPARVHRNGQGASVVMEGLQGSLLLALPVVVRGHTSGWIFCELPPPDGIDPPFRGLVADGHGATLAQIRQEVRGFEEWPPGSVRMPLEELVVITQTLAELVITGWELSKTVEELRLVQEISQNLASSANVREMVELIARRATEIFQAKGCIVRLFEKESGEAKILASYGLSERYLSKGPVPLDVEVERLMESGGIVYIEDVAEDPRFIYKDAAREEGLCSALFVGLISKNKPIGTARIYTAEPRQFSQRELDLLQTLASQAALAIENRALVDNLQRTNVQLREAYTSVRDTHERLVRAEKLAVVGELAAGMAHEVKNPQTAVYGLARTIHDRFDDLSRNEIRRLLKSIMAESKRTTAMVDEVRDFAREKAPTAEEAQLGDLCEDAAYLCQFDETLTHVTIAVERKSDPKVIVDSDKIKQVLLNLVRNGGQAMDGASGTVRLIVDQEDNWATVAVIDQGNGIPPEILERIWEPFFTTKRSGTGLGLDICRQIVYAHGGTISVETELGVGSTFIVRLPTQPKKAKKRTRSGTPRPVR